MRRRLAGAALALAGTVNAQAGEWEVTPRISASSVYTDNLALTADAASAWYAEVRPGISIAGQGGRVRLNLDYTALGRVFQHGAEGDRLEHQLRLDSNSELLDKRLFVDFDAAVRQLATTPDGALDLGGAALAGNRTEAVSYSVAPYWQARWAGWAESLLRLSREQTWFSGSVADALQHGVEIAVDSGTEFNRFGWGVQYLASKLERSELADSDRESAELALRYALGGELTLLGRVGFEDNSLSTRDSGVDGSYWSAGAAWQATDVLQLRALLGPRDSEFGVVFTPTSRTLLNVQRRDREVGLNTGVVWSGLLQHRSRYGLWSAGYTEDVTSVAGLVLELPFGVVVDAEGNPIGFFDEQGRFLDPGDLFGLRREEFLRKRWHATLTLARAHSQFQFGLFDERREFTVGLPSEHAWGLNASWNWGFAPRTTAIIGGQWRRLDAGAVGTDTLWLLRLGLVHQLGPRTSASLEYRHARNDATDPGDAYRENRISLSATMRF